MKIKSIIRRNAIRKRMLKTHNTRKGVHLKCIARYGKIRFVFDPISAIERKGQIKNQTKSFIDYDKEE